MSAQKKLDKAMATYKASAGQKILMGTKPSARNSHTNQKVTNANMAQQQQADMSKLRKGTTNALNRVMKQPEVDITGAEKAMIFDQIDPKNNGSQRSKKLGY